MGRKLNWKKLNLNFLELLLETFSVYQIRNWKKCGIINHIDRHHTTYDKCTKCTTYDKCTKSNIHKKFWKVVDDCITNHTRISLNLGKNWPHRVNIAFTHVIIHAFWIITTLWYNTDCVKSVQIWSYFWSVFSCIRTEYGDLQSKSTE